MSFAIVIDRNSTTPIRRQVYEQWRSGILSGRFRPGDRVPSTREMAVAAGVSRSTITEAWEQLAAEGYIEAIRGSGTFVCAELPDDLMAPRWKRVPSHVRERHRIKLSRYGASLTKDFRRAERLPAFINFPPGIPAYDRFPFALWRKLLLRHLRNAGPDLLDYAGYSGGLDRLRRSIANYVARLRAVRCTAEQVIIVNGSQQALDLCARILIEPGQAIGFENPGYPGARHAFEAYGANLIPLSIGEDGIATIDLTRNMRCVYVTPSHQFPTGVSMSLARRLEIIRWAHHSAATIIEDDYCSEYRYSGAPLPSLQSLGGSVPIVYIGTFSKVMFPGLRIGYMIVPRSLVARFERAKWLSDRHTAMLEQFALADFIDEGHLERHIRQMRSLYGRRRQVLVDSLECHFQDRARVLGSAAGMHAMVEFADDQIVRRANKNKVQVPTADPCYLTRPPGRQLVFGFSAIGEPSIREGIRRLTL